MKRVLFVFLILLFTVSVCTALVDPGVSTASPGPRVSLSFFYDALAPYGDWVRIEPWGWVWTPFDAGPGWRPYTLGHWVYTSFGWTWVSDEEWGWAPYHYGRWTWEPAYGWVWIPGTVWGPVDRYSIDDLQRPPRRGERIYRPEVSQEIPGAPPQPGQRDVRPLRDREIEKWEAEQRRELERVQRREMRRPPPGSEGTPPR